MTTTARNVEDGQRDETLMDHIKRRPCTLGWVSYPIHCSRLVFRNVLWSEETVPNTPPTNEPIKGLSWNTQKFTLS